MNYYPNYNNPSNYYLNYPYGGQYPSTGGMPQYQQPPQTQPISLQTNLNGKIVDSEDVVRATEVPIGGYGIFPKADLSEIYIKSWNNNGTTSIITFAPKPKAEPIVAEESNSNLTLNEMLSHIHRLELKIDTILNNSVEAPQVSAQPQVKKEVLF